ncbi:MAG: cytochrome c [Actinomycetota bacterium]|jgi:ubiquinol-cytochrome c reductase cytochrome c subunit|nr:cytochrome c [Actinomycetota bacterium]
MQRFTVRITKMARVLGLIAMVYATSLVVGSSTTSAGAQTDPGAELYDFHCAQCHQDNGVGIVGIFPPLADNPAASDAGYVESVIRDGKSGPLDVLGTSYDEDMPGVEGLSDEEITAITQFVVVLAGGSAEPPAGSEEDDAPLVVGDIDRGHDLFVGSNRFDSGAPACASCHTAGSDR